MQASTHLSNSATEFVFFCKPFFLYYTGQKVGKSRDIHEVDPQCDHVISCGIDFNLQRSLMQNTTGPVDVEPKFDIARCHMIELYYQPHEFLGCNDFLARVDMH